MLLLMDANVLIDYAKTDRQVLALVAQVLARSSWRHPSSMRFDSSRRRTLARWAIR